PDTRVGGDVHTELAGELEGGCFGEARVAGNVEGDLRAEQGRVVACALDDLAHRRVLGPLPGSPGQVAVRQDEATGRRRQRFVRRLAVVGGAQAVRPVDARGDA